MTPGVLIFSKKSWDNLSADDQKIIRVAAKDSVQSMREWWAEYEVSARKAIEATGAQTIKVDKQSFADVLRPLYTDLVADAHLQDLVRKIQADE